MTTKKIKTVDLLPEFLRTDKNSKFLSSTIDQFISPPNLERIDGYIGSKLTPTYDSATDNYIPETLPLRRNYQLEPALVVKDGVGTVEQVKAIDDLANEIVVEGGINNNFNRLFGTDYHSFNPHIDWDKFINYQNYYWLTTGPEIVEITGRQKNTTSIYSVTDGTLGASWVFTPDGLTDNPLITLYRGNTYKFKVSSSLKFYIKTAPTIDEENQYLNNVTNNGVANGTVEIVVDGNTPNTLYYSNDINSDFKGQFIVKNSDQNSEIDVEADIVGKANYTSFTGISLTNGMKIVFGGNVYPAEYANTEFFVEGVGKAIRLVNYVDLTSSEGIANIYNNNFDVESFDAYPFDNFKTLPIDPEYITINRASQDKNPWSRYNRWVHKDVIELSSTINGNTAEYPVDKRAKRPIIEFNADIQLYNFGSIGIKNVDIIDNDTLDAFSIVEGSYGYWADGIELEQGHRIIFAADTDPDVKTQIFRVNFIFIDGKKSLQLLPVDPPQVGSAVSVNFGTTNKGTSWWFNGSEWVYAQQHTTLNQAPLFDLFDDNGVSYSDKEIYNSDFTGNKVFGYEIGTVSDSVLGFPIKYKSNATTGVGSWLFKNYFSEGNISIIESDVVKQVPTSESYIKFANSLGESYANVWDKLTQYQIPILQFQTTTESTNLIEITSIDDAVNVDFTIEVFVDNNKVSSSKWNIVERNRKRFIGFFTSLDAGTDVLFKIRTSTPVNDNGWYEIPLGLTNNPLNGSMTSLTFTELSDHLTTMIDNSPVSDDLIDGTINLRDVDDLPRYGSRLISNQNPMSFAHFFVGIKEHSLIDAITKAGDQYNQFKMAFLKRISEITEQTDPISAVDTALKDLNKDKDLNSPWHLSDMVAYGGDKISRSWTVTDSRNTVYPISSDFDPTKLSLRSVLVYKNGTQLILGKDYEFVVNDSSVQFLTPLAKNDKIVINDYTDTSGSYVPSTPSKLGLYPKYQPEIYYDHSYVDGPVKVIQGHDGSITVAYDDFRDDIILELERRIFNNIKSQYNPELLDIDSILPGAFRNNEFSLTEVNTVLQRDFIKWAGFYGIDYTDNSSFNQDDPFTWNYSGGYNTTIGQSVEGSWRAVFDYFYDTYRPNTHPWEMLGFTEQPLWWEDEYGPAPYTSGNEILWDDLEVGLIKQGSRAGVYSNYARPGLKTMLPVDEYGDIVDPSLTLITNITAYNRRQGWKFGDIGPAEAAWRRSSYWPFAIQRLLALTKPATYSSVLYDPSRLVKNNAGQWIYNDSFLNLKTVQVPGVNNALTSGYSSYVSEIGLQKSSNYLTTLSDDLSYVDFNLFHKVGGFVNKNKIQLLIDAIAPNSTSPGSLLPLEDYSLILNVSNPIASIGISGIIVQKSNGKFVIKGYDKFNPYFNVHATSRNANTPAITVGGISESYVVWEPSTSSTNNGLSSIDTTTAQAGSSNRFYQAGQLVRYQDKFYRVKSSHIAESEFDSSLYTSISQVPVKGGATVQLAASFSQSVKQVPYGTELNSIQEVYDLIIGYGHWLESQGFVFDEYNSDLNSVVDWNMSGKEFLYWTTQNWADKSIITLSPFASQIKYSSNYSVVDNVFDSFYEYSLLNSGGRSFPKVNVDISRDEGVCTIKTVNTNDGIYFAVINAVQKEHAMVFNNTTVFNDTIYEIQTGYRQRRMRISGFRTAEWNGDYFSPGFVYDEAVISPWKIYTDYNYGDVVRYAGNYYSAIKNVSGSVTFNFNSWALLGTKPLADLLPNFDYKINQFEDFYSLDIDNFDVGQQKMAQHLIGYTPRVYLNNIFTNPIAQYKFYQGYIKEKGTKNAINKLAKATLYNQQGQIDYTEEWAFRIGQYGSYPTYQELEFPLVEGSFVENPHVISFVDEIPANPNDLIHYTTATDLSISPVDYNPGNTFATTSTNLFEINIAGYVNFNDVTYQIYSEDDLLSIEDNRTINEGDTYWVGFKPNGDWGILRYVRVAARVTAAEVTTSGSEITVTTDYFHGLSVGDIISITQFNIAVDGIYRIISIPTLDSFTIETTLSVIMSESEASGSLFRFADARYSSFDNLPSDTELLNFPTGTYFWVDNNQESNHWAVYEKIKNYSGIVIANPTVPPAQHLGYSINKQKNRDLIIVGAPGFVNDSGIGRVFLYDIDAAGVVTKKLNYVLNDTISYDDGGNSEFGHSVAYADTDYGDTGYGLFFVGAPGAGHIPKGSSGTGIRYANDYPGFTSTNVQEGALKISSIDPVTISEKAEAVLLSPLPAQYQRFGHTFAINTVTEKLFVGAPGTETTGSGYVFVYDVNYQSTTTAIISNLVDMLQGDNIGSHFGWSIASANNDITVIGSPGYYNYGIAKVFSGTNLIQLLDPTALSLPEEMFDPESPDYSRFGEVVYITPDGNTLMVSAPGHLNANGSYGAVVIYTWNPDQQQFDTSSTGTYKIQILINPVPGQAMRFGTALDYDIDTGVLVVSAVGTNKSVPMVFDTDNTSFDAESTKFKDTVENFGTVYVYNKKSDGIRFVIAEELQPTVNTESDIRETKFGSSVYVDNHTVYVGAPGSENTSTSRFYKFDKIELENSSINLSTQFEDSVDIEIIDKIALYDVNKETVLEYLDVIDPAKGKIAGLADQELKYKSSFDPAVYSTGTSEVIIDENSAWLENHVGELWWDLSSVKYVWYEQVDLIYRKNNWGGLFPGATIDVYEWVGSEYLPAEWSDLADTSAGLTENISGQPKYGNTVYSVKEVFNAATNSFGNYYYYWVKNKVTVPNIKNRRISSYQVASLIKDPTSYGLKYASIVGKNAVMLANVGPLLVGDNIHLSIAFDNDKNNIARHTEWLLLQEGSARSVPNTLLEKKLIDSLLGHDGLGNAVPDPLLTDRTRYGISVRPRQTLFKDRKEALRNIIEFSNEVLLKNIITGSYSFENLLKQESSPTVYSHEYDQEVEDNEALLLVDTVTLEQAEISCTVKNGKIIGTTIVKAGFGYKISPSVTIIGDTTGAKISTEIDGFGRVISCTIENPGNGYPDNEPPILEVRPYTVVVLADSLYKGKWTIFVWDKLSGQWTRKRTQKYNTTLYWNYIDWSSDNFNSFLDYSYTVNEVYEVNQLQDLEAGQYIKVKNGGDGRYIILEKTAAGTSGTFDSDFNIVYSERGTIQISDSLWNSSLGDYGFDDLDTRYDQTLYDQTPDLELSYILQALKTNLFVGELKVNWNLLFFKSVRYALTEQKLLDWAFKTSFINVTNYAGGLNQRPIYKLENTSYYEEYLKEVKPYHTQLRSYTTNYTVNELSGTYTTDFDLPPKYNPATGKFEVLYSDLTDYPWKSWLNNASFTIGSIIIGNTGAGYKFPPEVVIETAELDVGTGATAVAYISSGKVVRIEVTNPGKDYFQIPKVIIRGGGATTEATAYAQLYNGKVRSNTIGMRFDRISKTNQIGDYTAEDNFICNGASNEFVLTWLAEHDKSKIDITLDGDLVLGSDYKIEYYTELYNGYNKKFSKIVFLNYTPLIGQLLSVSYYKNIELFNATERILKYYNPTSGMPGNDLSQLMDGIEYSRTSIEGLPFDYTTKWDIEHREDGNQVWASKFDESAWADDIGFYTVITATSVSSTLGGTATTISLSTTTGIRAGQYVNVISTLTSVFSTATVTVLGVNSSTRVVTFNTTTVTPITTGSSIEFWTLDANAAALDSAIDGGDLSRTYALGINPEDITIDGDTFVSPHRTYAPDEVIPGYVSDSVGINVYTRNTGTAAPTVLSNSFDIIANTVTVRKLSIVPPNKDSISVTYNRKLFEYSEATNFTELTDSTLYSINWETNEIIVGPQSVSGRMGYTIITIGSNAPTTDVGTIDVAFTVATNTSTAQVQSLSDTGTVKSAYVTVNGISISETVNSLEPCYTLSYVGVDNKRAAVNVRNLSTSTTSTIQAWFFGNEHHYYNEVREQFITYSTSTTTYELLYPPGHIEPQAAAAMVEVISTETSAIRLTPPSISYYMVSDETQTEYPIDNHGIEFDIERAQWEVRAYLNGNKLTPGADYLRNPQEVFISIRSGILRKDDVLAILVIPKYYPYPDYDINNDRITIKNTSIIHEGEELRIVTFTNHDDMLMRTERFRGNTNRRFTISRPILNDNYVWVDVNRVPLINHYDFEVLDDQLTIQISDSFELSENDNVVITTIGGEQINADILGYRIFNDSFNRTHFKRLSKQNSTVLAKPLSYTHTEITVVDASVLTPPMISKKIPGVILVDAERIEFFKVNGNVLSQLRRATLGTGMSEYSPTGTKVIDQSPDQTVPFAETLLTQHHWTSASTNTYIISTVTAFVSSPLGDAIKSDGITLLTNPVFNESITDPADSSGNTVLPVNAVDQISVYYGGRLLRKTGIIYHDTTVAFDSPEYNLVGTTSTVELLPNTIEVGTAYIVEDTNKIWVYEASLEVDAVNGYVYKGLNYAPSEFTVTTSTQKLILNVSGGVKDDIKLVITKKQFNRNAVWNNEITTSTTETLMHSTTAPARFLQARLAELPDRYYYGR